MNDTSFARKIGNSISYQADSDHNCHEGSIESKRLYLSWPIIFSMTLHHPYRTITESLPRILSAQSEIRKPRLAAVSWAICARFLRRSFSISKITITANLLFLGRNDRRETLAKAI